jgi:tRNA G18 (ribose-2'-O)-methylase SpoU
MAIPILIAQLKIAGVTLYASASAHAATDDRARTSLEADLTGPVAIFIGNEGGGLPGEILHSADGMLSIPICGDAESLNAGIAASILLYEAARQRTLGHS